MSCNRDTKLRIIGLSLVITFCVISAAVSFWFDKKNVNAKEVVPVKTEENKAVQPFATVVIDAGHGGFDSGALGIGTSVREDVLNLDVAKKVCALLEAQSVSVIMTRSDDMALGETKSEDMAKRRSIMRTEGVDIIVSIHMNEFTDKSVKGPMVFYMDGSTQGAALAKKLLDSLCAATGNRKRLPNPGNYFVLRESAFTAAIVECGFLSNYAEEKLLTDEKYRAILAEAIAKGIMEYLAETLP